MYTNDVGTQVNPLGRNSRCLRAPKNKFAGPEGVPPHLLRHLPHHLQEQLYLAILDIWRGNKIPPTRLASRVILIYKKKDPQDPRNYRPIYVFTAIYGILTRMMLKRITTAMATGLLNIQHRALSGTNTTTPTATLVNDLHKTYLWPCWKWRRRSHQPPEL